MTRHLPAFTRALILLCVTMLLGTAIAQEPLPLPPAPDEPVVTEEILAPESTAEPVLPVDPALPTEPLPVEPFILPDGGPGRFDPDNLDELPDMHNEPRDVMTRGNYDASKLDGQLAELMERFVHGDIEGSETVARNYWLPRDRRGRYLVVVWPADGVRAKGLANSVKALGGKVDNADRKAVYARLDKAQIAMLSTDPKVGLIQTQPVGRVEPEATSSFEGRTPAGAVVSEGFDVANAITWHNAGNTGASVNVAIIDFGFGPTGTTTNSELACLNNFSAGGSVSLTFGSVGANDTRRGLDMAEVICDIAPGAKVRLYKVTTSDNLYDAITAAKNNHDVIVIGADFGANFSPGDGTFGRGSSKNVYQALATAKSSGVTVIAAAGNSNQAYRTFTMLQGSNVTVSISNTRPGDQVNLSWNDWDSQPNNGGAREDLSATLTGSPAKPARGAGNPAHQFTVSCTPSGGICAPLTLTLSNITGNPINNELIVQVNVTGGVDRSITAVNGASINWFGGLNQAPTLSRPADSPHVIAVGAVCSNYQGNFPLENYSGVGPKFNPGGGFNGIPAGDFYGPNEVKPEIVGPANLSVFNNQLSGPIEDANCNFGFRGTQASAAHVAGMTALLLNNSLVSGFNGLNTPLNILHYWRTHSVDLPLAGHPKGYDMQYGAGLAVLGMPDYDYDKALNAPVYAAPNRLPPGICTNVTYVGPRNAGNSDYDGTVENPFQSVAHAAHVQGLAGGNRCVIVLPGEYVAPILIDTLSSDVGVFGYSGVTLNAGVERSTIVVQNKYWEPIGSSFKRRAGIFVNDSPNLVMGGLNFVTGDIYEPSFEPPGMLAVKNSPGFQLIRSRFNGIQTNKPLIDIFGSTHGASISDNRFVNNNGLSGGSIIAVYNSGTDAARVSIRGNRFTGNITNDGSWPMISVANSISWVPMIRSLDSYTDIVNNTISGNTAESLLQGATTLDDMPFEFRVLGNAIVGNTISSAEFTPPGPLIHGFYQRYIMIVNNTIAQNQFINSGTPFDTLFARGDDILNNGGAEMNGSLTEVLARWEIHGNLIVGNGSDALVKEMDQAFSSGAQCRNFAGADDVGATHNWIFNSYDGNSGDCDDSLTSLANNNILNVDPSGDIMGGANPNDPEYWAPNGSETPAPHLKDGGPTAFVTALMPFFNNTDARGDARINNLAVDIGAYEFTTFELVSDPISIVANEDSGVIEFDINDPIYITGGFPPYTVTLVDAPDYYGTGCDSRFTSPGAQGTAVETIDDDTLTIAYCPPHQFHTNTSDPEYTGNPLQIIVEIRDAVGNPLTATINYTINPVNDDPLGTSIETTAAVAIQRDANHVSGTNEVRLRPYVDFAGDSLLDGSKFYFSEWLNPTGTAADEADYDYTYPALPTLVVDPDNVNPESIANNLVWVDQPRGIFGVNLGAVSTSATAKLQYTVLDSNGNDVVNTIIIKAVPAPAPFILLTPGDGFSVGNIDSFAGFTWQVSANAQTYDLVVARKIEPPYIEVIRLIGLTPQVDTDNLDCDATNCVLELTDAEKITLIDSEYRWAVYADNQGLKVRSNDQFDFVVAAGRELLLNGGFEVAGSNAKLADKWKLSNATKDRRSCGGGAASGLCFFNFTANLSSAATLTQKIPGIGRKGDLLTLTTSVKTTKLKAGAGVLQVIVKYTTGDKGKITLPAPSGTQNFALANANPLELRYPVANYTVKLQIRKGTGKMALDNVSLNLDEKIEFDLLTPTDGTVTAKAADVTQLTWLPSASAPTYQVLLIETLAATPIINNTTFTAAADADALACARGQCVLTLAAPLANGDYVWTVTASNGFEPENAPFTFTIDSVNRTELVGNGGFEANNAKKIPGTWKASKLGKSISVCENGTSHPEYQGACAFVFMGGSSTTLSQNLSTAGLASGQILTLSAAAESQRALAGGQIKLTITYNNGSTVTRKINILTQTRPWQTYTAAPITLTSNVKKVALSLKYTGKSGKILLDNVSVIRSTQ